MVVSTNTTVIRLVDPKWFGSCNKGYNGGGWSE